ncbi:MAG: bifunctional phosphopantothenoylcysteine decarboxylase/phosphopantothenate--cysteine ligase CoaBC [Oscillospiraceae bacterium]|nr:bifunctional phosphopantothenoylcysteine decarboxylase/phosphopantothenate--cysteine ligase CoaBC [Oscillospiraceae bacterium]
MKTVVLGVTGSIAAYKACEIVNTLVKSGYEVHVIMTQAGTKFVTPLTFQTLSCNKVYTNQFEEIANYDVRHISLSQKADAFLLAPATANIIAKIANGIADDMLTTVVMAARRKPIIICPAMNTAMYENAITQKNIDTLSGLGYTFVEPKESRLACGDVGKGALADVTTIVEALESVFRESGESNQSEVNKCS